MTIISKFNDNYQAGSDEINLRNPLLTAREAGSIIDTQLGATAAIADEIIVSALQKIQELFIDSAEGAALDKIAYDRYGLERNDSIQSVGTLTFSRATADAGDITIEIGSQFSTNPTGSDDEILFETTETKILTGTTVDIATQAVEGGISGNVNAATITVIKTALDDATITVSNSAVFTGGVDEETDPNFRDRIKKYLKTLRKGTVEAVEFGGTFVAGVAYSKLDESTAGDGYITLYIADENGNSNAELEDKVRDEIINWRSCGVTVNVDSATIVSQTLDMSLTYDAGVDTDAVKLLAISAAEDYRDSLNVGATLYKSALISSIQAVQGIKAVTINTPAGNVEPETNEIIRDGTVTVS